MFGPVESTVQAELKGVSAYIEQQLSLGWSTKQPCWDVLCNSVTTMIKESNGPLSAAGAAEIMKVLKDTAFRDHEKNLIAASIRERVTRGGGGDAARSMERRHDEPYMVTCS